MDLITRCPRCNTTFPASLEQLQLRKGYIRCVSCAHIFDGYEAIVSEPAPATGGKGRPVPNEPVRSKPGPSVANAARPEPALIIPVVVRQRQPKEEPVHTIARSAATLPAPGRESAFTISDDEPVTAAEEPAEPVFRMGSADARRPVQGIQEPISPRDAPIEPIMPAIRTRRPDRPAGNDRFPVPPAQVPVGQMAATDSIVVATDSIYAEPRPVPQRPGESGPTRFPDDKPDRYLDFVRVFWGALIIIGMVVLLMQLAYVYRVQIASQAPVLRPMLEQTCVSLKCTVPYSRRIDDISIVGSSLRSNPKAGNTPDAEPDSMVLQLTLRNSYRKPQEWPTLVLELKDFSGTVVVKKNLPPQSYLTSEALRQPFAAASEVVVGIPITLDGVKVNGYQLSKFFP